MSWHYYILGKLAAHLATAWIHSLLLSLIDIRCLASADCQVCVLSLLLMDTISQAICSVHLLHRVLAWNRIRNSMVDTWCGHTSRLGALWLRLPKLLFFNTMLLMLLLMKQLLISFRSSHRHFSDLIKMHLAFGRWINSGWESRFSHNVSYMLWALGQLQSWILRVNQLLSNIVNVLLIKLFIWMAELIGALIIAILMTILR